MTASKNATVVLLAVWGRDPHGEWTVAEYLNCTNLTFTLGGDTPFWYGEKVSRDDKVGMMRFGAIGDSQTNWIETVVTGAGQIGFWWKANGEYEVSKKGVITRYDYAEFTVSVKDVAIGSDAAAENLKTIFGLEGTPSLGSAAFDPKNVTIEFGEPKDGKLKFTAKPNTGDSQALPASFFMKMKVR